MKWGCGRLHDGSYMSREVHVQLCVHRRLACSAGDKLAGARVSGPVAWIAGRRETEFLKPIDERSPRETCELSGCNENERGCGFESEKLRRPRLQL